jgi:hypothetical protein
VATVGGPGYRSCQNLEEWDMKRRVEDPRVDGDEGGSEVSVSLVFAQAECRRCRAVRLATQRCPDCGAAAERYEVDPRVQRRQRVATSVRQRLDDERASALDGTSEALSLEQVIAAIAGWPSKFLAALDRAASASGEAAELMALTDVVTRARSGVSGFRLRPDRESCRAALVTLDRLDAVTRAWMQAFCAATPIEAEASAKSAQETLDRAVDPIQDLVERMVRLELIRGTTAEELIPALAAAASSAAGGDGLHRGLSVVDEAGHTMFSAITDASDPPVGVGVSLHMMSLVVDVTMDRQRFIDVAKTAYRALTAREDRLIDVIQDPEWGDAHARANQQAFHLAIASVAVQASASNDQMVVESLLSSVHRLVEGQARHLLATLLAVASGRKYQGLKRRDLGDVITQVEQAGLGMVLEGLQSPIRNAAAHMDFRVTADNVILNVDRGPSTTCTHAEVLDIALAAQESTLGLLAGLTCAIEVLAAGHAGLDLVTSALPADSLLQSVLMLAGWREVVIEHEGAESRITGEGTLVQDALPLAAAIELWLPSSANWLLLSDTQDGWTRQLRVDVDALRAWKRQNSADAEDDHEQQCALLTVMARSTFDGEPLASADVVKGWIASQANEARRMDYRLAVPRLRSLIRLSHQLGQDDLETLLRGVITALRTAATVGDRDS